MQSEEGKIQFNGKLIFIGLWGKALTNLQCQRVFAKIIYLYCFSWHFSPRKVSYSSVSVCHHYVDKGFRARAALFLTEFCFLINHNVPHVSQWKSYCVALMAFSFCFWTSENLLTPKCSENDDCWEKHVWWDPIISLKKYGKYYGRRGWDVWLMPTKGHQLIKLGLTSHPKRAY